jgi:diadenosine tetraphosphate (Ap4A) HIT family hydrolase
VLALDDACVLIRDAFPKARAHALVLPRAAGLDGVADLTRAHLPLLARMQARCECRPPVARAAPAQRSACCCAVGRACLR